MVDKTTIPQDYSLFYKSLFDNLLDGLAYCQMIFDTQGHPVDFIYIQVNKNFEELTGLKNAEGKKATEIIPGINKSNQELLEICGRVSLTGRSERFEIYTKPLSRWFLVSAYSPKKGFFVAFFQNITDRKLMEKNLEDARIAARNVLEDLQAEREALASANAKDKAILENIGEGVLAIDSERKVLFLNKAGEDLLGWKEENLVGTVINSLPLEDTEGRPVELKNRPTHISMTEGKNVIADDYLFVRNDKTKFAIGINVMPIKINEKTVGAITVFRDITREKEVDHAKDEFMSIASHELRAPLGIIKSFISMILEGDYGEVNPKLSRPLQDIFVSTERIIHLVNDMLNASRIEAGRMLFKLSEFPLGTLIGKIVLDFAQLAKDGGNTIEVKNPSDGGDEITIQADQDKVREILNNLISNSLKFTDHGTITIYTKKAGEFIFVFVADTGIGISSRDQQKIFGKFQQAGSMERGKPQGTGLGLYICKSLVEKMGGRVWLENSSIGGGSVFAFSLPQAGTAAAKKARLAIEPASDVAKP